jgi:hypothetical protein
MFIEPTFSTLLHKALTTKSDAKADLAPMMSLPENGHQVAIYDDQGRELLHNRRLWNVEVSLVNAVDSVRQNAS